MPVEDFNASANRDAAGPGRARASVAPHGRRRRIAPEVT
jgi:hypothetical protein